MHRYSYFFFNSRNNENVKLQNAKVKMLIICCYYIILGLGAPLAFTISSVYLNGLQRELQDYFECEGCGVDSNQICDRSHYEKFVNPALITIGYSLFALYPVVTLIYIVEFSAMRSFIGRMRGKYQILVNLSSQPTQESQND